MNGLKIIKRRIECDPRQVDRQQAGRTIWDEMGQCRLNPMMFVEGDVQERKESLLCQRLDWKEVKTTSPVDVEKTRP